MPDWREPLWQPLLRYADFKGRSRRTELAGFWVLVMVGGLVLRFGTSLLEFELAMRIEPILSILCAAALLCPTLALFARRLHDSGRSGWWLLLGLPAVGTNLWEDFVRLDDPLALPGGLPLPLPVALAIGIGLLVLIVLLLWDDDPEPNRYGPNPPGTARPRRRMVA